MYEQLTVEELKKHKYVGLRIDEKEIAKYNAATKEQKESARFHVALIRNGGDDYTEEAFSSRCYKTIEEALDFLKGCCYNEVEYEVYLVLTYDEGHGVHFANLANLYNFEFD